MKCLVILGPPGAGKGTQCALLQERLGLMHVSTGNLVRQEMKLGTPLGMRVKAVVDAGRLVDDETICACLEAELLRLAALPPSGRAWVGSMLSRESVVLLDGLPRNLAQTSLLDDTLARAGASIAAVLNFEVDLDVLRNRIADRRVCKNCQKVDAREHIEKYQLHEMICSQADPNAPTESHVWTQRPDDTAEVVDRRLKIYSDETRPVAGVYEKRGQLDHVPGLGTPEVVYSRVSHAIVERLGLT